MNFWSNDGRHEPAFSKNEHMSATNNYLCSSGRVKMHCQGLMRDYLELVLGRAEHKELFEDRAESL